MNRMGELVKVMHRVSELAGLVVRAGHGMLVMMSNLRPTWLIHRGQKVKWFIVQQVADCGRLAPVRGAAGARHAERSGAIRGLVGRAAGASANMMNDAL